ncbi:MAG TPA: hypothetical protein PL065_13845 [Polyangiaceae bacterium]|nr:hypothetical protein [Polyangiaceae bacterium]
MSAALSWPWGDDSACGGKRAISCGAEGREADGGAGAGGGCAEGRRKG